MATPLTPLQEKFAAEYLVDLNATQAAIRAGYSARTANRKGSELLQKPEIQKVIQKRRVELQQKTEITQERILAELASIAFADVTDYVNIVADENGHCSVAHTPTDILPGNKKAAISGIKQGAYGIEIKLCDKLRSLEKLGEYLGMYKDKQTDADNSIRIKIDGPEDYSI